MHCRAARSGAPILSGVAIKMSWRACHWVWRGTLSSAPLRQRFWIAAAGAVAAAAFQRALAPQREGVAIAPLLRHLLRREPRRVLRLAQFTFGCRFPHVRSFHPSPFARGAEKDHRSRCAVGVSSVSSPLPSGEREPNTEGATRVRGDRPRKSAPSNPPHPLATLATSPHRGEVKINQRSRCALFCRRCGFSDLGSSTFSIARGDFGFFLSLPWKREKGSGTPGDADPYPPHPAVRLCLPLRKQLACRRSTRGSRQRDFRPQGSASGHASWDAAGASDPLIALPGEDRTPLHGRYPRRACPSPVKHLTRRS